MCCLIFSRRGLAYFGVLVQLLVCLLLIPVITVPVGLTLGVSPSNSSGRDLSRVQIAFVVGYSCGMCITAILIFRGIRRESFYLISIAVVSLLVLQSGAGGITITSWIKVPLKGRDTRGILLVRAAIVILNISSTLLYTTLLILYGRVLRTQQKTIKERSRSRPCNTQNDEEDDEESSEDSYGPRTSLSSA